MNVGTKSGENITYGCPETPFKCGFPSNAPGWCRGSILHLAYEYGVSFYRIQKNEIPPGVFCETLP